MSLVHTILYKAKGPEAGVNIAFDKSYVVGNVITGNTNFTSHNNTITSLNPILIPGSPTTAEFVVEMEVVTIPSPGASIMVELYRDANNWISMDSDGGRIHKNNSYGYKDAGPAGVVGTRYKIVVDSAKARFYANDTLYWTEVTNIYNDNTFKVRAWSATPGNTLKLNYAYYRAAT